MQAYVQEQDDLMKVNSVLKTERRAIEPEDPFQEFGRQATPSSINRHDARHL